MKIAHIPVKDILYFLDEYLRTDTFSDYCKNGIQIHGSPMCNGIIGGVSISLALIAEAVRRNINTILVHHGLIWKNTNLLEIKGALKNRLKIILENDINLIGYHLPLDAHPEIGNNISIIKMLDNGNLKEVSAYDMGFRAIFDPPLHSDDIEHILHISNFNYIFHPAEKKFINKVIAVSGAASQLYESISDNDCDLFITGEIKESSYRLIEEIKIAYISLGHYCSEVFGVRNLCNLIENRFGINTHFIDIPNPY